MVSTVSGYSPVYGASTMDKVSSQQLQNPGLYTSPGDTYETQSEQKSGGSIFGTIGKVLLTAAVVGGGAIAARKFIPALKDYKPVEKLAEDAKPLEKIKNGFVKAADWIEEHTIGYFKKKGDASTTAENAPDKTEPTKS